MFHISESSSIATIEDLVFAPRSTKEVAYKTFVSPKLKYNAAPLWSPYSKLQVKQIEKVQRIASCWTYRRW